jgi:Big-like domain-containing protein
VYFNFENPTTVTINATVTAPTNRDPVPTGDVSVTDQFFTDYGHCTLDSSGSCTRLFSSNDFPVPLDVQTLELFQYAMTATYSGDANYDGASSAPFIESVECDTFDSIDDYYTYEDVYDPGEIAWNTYWWYNEETITYNCQEVVISDNIQILNDGIDPCEWVDYDTYCDGIYLWESDLYWCDDFGQDDYEWTDWYQVVLVHILTSYGGASASGDRAQSHYDAQVMRSWKGGHAAGDVITFFVPVGGLRFSDGTQAERTVRGFSSFVRGGRYVLFLLSAAEEGQNTPSFWLVGDGVQGVFLLSEEKVEPLYQQGPLWKTHNHQAVSVFLSELDRSLGRP